LGNSTRGIAIALIEADNPKRHYFTNAALENCKDKIFNDSELENLRIKNLCGILETQLVDENGIVLS